MFQIDICSDKKLDFLRNLGHFGSFDKHYWQSASLAQAHIRKTAEEILDYYKDFKSLKCIQKVFH